MRRVSDSGSKANIRIRGVVDSVPYIFGGFRSCEATTTTTADIVV